MRYRVLTFGGLGLFAVSLFGFCSSLSDLLEVGTCASGNQPFVISQECPDGAGGTVLVLIGSIIGLCISFLLVALRGNQLADGLQGPRLLTLMFGSFFAISGAYTLIFSLGSDSIDPDAELGGTIVGITFLIMGVPILLLWAWWAIAALRSRDERPVG